MIDVGGKNKEFFLFINKKEKRIATWYYGY
jgi:hypothetical protein